MKRLRGVRVSNCDFFLLDTRSHRSPNFMPDGPEKTLLGSRQREELFAQFIRCL